MRITLQLDQFNLMSAFCGVAHHHADINAATVITVDQIFMLVALPDHFEQIAIFKGIQCLEVIDLLQAENIRAGLCNR